MLSLLPKLNGGGLGVSPEVVLVGVAASVVVVAILLESDEVVPKMFELVEGETELVVSVGSSVVVLLLGTTFDDSFVLVSVGLTLDDLAPSIIS